MSKSKNHYAIPGDVSTPPGSDVAVAIRGAPLSPGRSTLDNAGPHGSSASSGTGDEKAIEIEVYDYEASACCTKVRWALAEADLPWKRRRVDLLHFEHKTREHLEIDPDGTVPVARFADSMLRDTNAILYQVAALSKTILLPRDSVLRADVKAWLAKVSRFHSSYAFVLGNLVLVPARRQWTAEERTKSIGRIHSAKARDGQQRLLHAPLPAQKIADHIARLKLAFEYVDGALAGKHWLVGDSMSLADIAMFPYVNSPLRLVRELWDGRLSRLTGWHLRMESRAAGRAAIDAFPLTAELQQAIQQAPGSFTNT